MKKKDFEHFLVDMLRECRDDEDANYFEYAEKIINGIEEYGFAVPPYFYDVDYLIKVSSYIGESFCWEPEDA